MRRAAAFVIAFAGAVALVAGSSAASAVAPTLYVSARGSDAGLCTRAAPCATIGRAVFVAPSSSTIRVAAGTYHEDVRILKNVAVVGVGRPVVDATGLDNGFVITGAKAAGASVEGFVVQNARFEGILAFRTARVTIRSNTVRQNDRGAAENPQKGECAPQGEVPGDCGEGLHLMSVIKSRVVGNVVTANAGGILLTDELGPAAANVISGNTVTDNLFDCGITIAGHNSHAVVNGVPHPLAAGIYGNTIEDNVSNGNGVKGEGAGILLAAGAPGAAVYENLVIDNTATGNAMAGITVHGHTPNQYLDGNVIVGNTLANDAIGGATGPGDSDAKISKTAGIVIFSAVAPILGTVVAGNQISNVYYGVWTHNGPTIDRTTNTFATVQVPVQAA